MLEEEKMKEMFTPEVIKKLTEVPDGKPCYRLVHLKEEESKKLKELRMTAESFLRMALHLYVKPNYGVKETAQILGKHPKTIRRWIKKGILPCIREGGRIKIRADDIKRLEKGTGRYVLIKLTEKEREVLRKLGYSPGEFMKIALKKYVEPDAYIYEKGKLKPIFWEGKQDESG